MPSVTFKLGTSLPYYADDTVWSQIYSFLQPLVKHWFRFSGVLSWRGQEEDVAEDIVQDAITHTFRYSQRAERDKVSEIGSLKGLSNIIAHHHYYLRIRESRLTLFSQFEYSSEGRFNTYALVRDDEVDPSEIALDNVFQEVFFLKVAGIVVNFPSKQSTTLLLDLENHMDFGIKPTPLQRAFLGVGTHLQDYQQPHPVDAKQRSRDASRLSLAYKRVVQEYSSAA